MVVAYQLQTESVQSKIGVFLPEAHTLDGSIDGVARECFQGDIGYDVAHVYMIGVELTGCTGFGKHMVRHLAPSYQEGVDAQIQV